MNPISPSALAGQTLLITGASRGLGRGLAEACVAHGARIIAIARGEAALAELKQDLGEQIIPITADINADGVADALLVEHQPDTVILNAGMAPAMAPFSALTWDQVDAIWQHDVRAGLQWMQAALRHMKSGRVLVTSSGAAMQGSPLSGGYAGAKRMLWMFANYAQGCVGPDQDLLFQTLLPRRLFGGTGVGDVGAGAYAQRKQVEVAAFLDGFGAPLSPRGYGDHVVALLANPALRAHRAFGIEGNHGLQPLD